LHDDAPLHIDGDYAKAAGIDEESGQTNNRPKPFIFR